jgi:plastocyanin
LTKLPFLGAILAIALLSVAIVSIIESNINLASAQVSKIIPVSIVSEASQLTNTAYQPNPINIKVGDTIEWINDDSSPHTVTEKNRSVSSNDESDMALAQDLLKK